MQFTEQHFAKALSYLSYKAYSEELLTNISKDATNNMNGYATTNLHILQRLQSTVKLNQNLVSAIEQQEPFILVIITEGYCGDSAQTFPVFGKMQEMFPEKVEIKVLLRDEHLEITDKYLTNGSRAIPKVICLTKRSLKERFVWGNRPRGAQEIMDKMKVENATQQEKSVVVHRWYAQDKTQSIQNELATLLLNNN